MNRGESWRHVTVSLPLCECGLLYSLEKIALVYMAVISFWNAGVESVFKCWFNLHCGSGAGVRGTLDTLSAWFRTWESPGWYPEKPFILISATVQGEVRQQWRLLEEFYLTLRVQGLGWLFLNPLSIATRLAFKEIIQQEDSICLLMVT